MKIVQESGLELPILENREALKNELQQLIGEDISLVCERSCYQNRLEKRNYDDLNLPNC